MNQIERIVKSGQCLGCGLCASVGASVGVQMTYVEGQLRPSGINKLSRAQCQTVVSTCRAVRSDYVVDEKRPLLNGEQHDQLWGNYFTCKTGFATNEVLRHKASSGGAISAIAIWLLKSGAVKHIVTTDYDAKDKLKTITKMVDSEQEVIACSGSKYCPAAPLQIIETIRKTDGKVAVIGRPCDVSALRLMLSEDKELEGRIFVLISFFCAGTPSDFANDKLLKSMGVANREDLVSFRHRGDGWPGYSTAVLKNGSSHRRTYAESWGGILNKDLQLGCKICADGIGEAADIVAADAWYGDESGYPDFSEAKGRSLIIARTIRGRDILADVERAGAIEAENVAAREIDRMQPGQLKRRRCLAVRVFAMKLMLQRVPKYNYKALQEYQAETSMKDKFVTFIGTIVRVFKSKRMRKLGAKVDSGGAG